jgi:CDP-diacylglycerol--serine O-phosphatidyltransferase
MKDQKTEKESRKRRRLKYIVVLPSIVTLINSLCGFVSIVCTSRGADVFLHASRFRRTDLSFFAMAGYMIFFAMIADLLDGQVARLSGSASEFGGQLDSLSDAISFGVAPAFLMFKIMEVSLKERISAGIGPFHSAGRWLLFAGIFYVFCAVIRLARFNVENDEDDSAHEKFAGLPSPAAAGIVVSLVVFKEDFLPRLADRLPALFSVLTNLTVWLLPFAVLASGILMVTRIKYPHLPNMVLRGKKTFISFLLLLFICLLVVWNIQLAMLLGFWGFAAAGFIRFLVVRTRRE